MMFWQPGLTLEEMEKQVILQALQFYQGNKVQTASALGIAHRTLYYKLDKYEGKISDDTSDKVQPGICVEPGKETPTQQSMPVRQPEKVQEVLSRQAASGNTRKRG